MCSPAPLQSVTTMKLAALGESRILGSGAVLDTAGMLEGQSDRSVASKDQQREKEELRQGAHCLF